MELGCPDSHEQAHEPRVSHRSMEDTRVFTDRLLGEVESFYSSDLFLGPQKGKRGVLHALFERVACTVSREASSLGSTALSVVADRVAVPQEAGNVDPGDWLGEGRAEIFRDLLSQGLPEHPWGEVVTACHRVPLEEEAKLAEKLIANGMVQLVPEAELAQDSQGRLLVGGFFSVKKSEDEDRLIYDRRPQNATMQQLPWAKLPNGSLFCRMKLLPNEYLRGSGDDLRNYYYTLRLSGDWHRFNAVGRRVLPDLVAQAGFDPKVPHRMRVLGMGDINGCAIAQATHEAILEHKGLLGEDRKLVFGEPVPAKNVWEGAYLDDLLVVHKVQLPYEIPLNGSFSPPLPEVTDVDMQLIRAAEAAYSEAGLQRALHKSFRAQTQFKAWGAEIDCIIGRVGAPLETRRQVRGLIRSLYQVRLTQNPGLCCLLFPVSQGTVCPPAPHLQVC